MLLPMLRHQTIKTSILRHSEAGNLGKNITHQVDKVRLAMGG
jgi:hypothetical protein